MLLGSCRWVLSMVLALAVLAGPAARGEAAESGGPQALVAEPDRMAVRQVIESQIAAFRNGDAAAAFAFAAPEIRRLFATPERFMAMVRERYTPLYRSRAVEFKEAMPGRTHSEMAQKVVVLGDENVPSVALYLLERQPDGIWLITGCILLAAEETAT